MVPNKSDANSSKHSNRAESVERDDAIEEAKYSKFLYDITQEIMRNRLYTDEEIQEVFKKHLDMNSGTLNRVCNFRFLAFKYQN